MTKNSVHGIKSFQRQVRKYLLKNRLHKLSRLKNQQRINCMIKTYDLIYYNPAYYRADLLLATFKEHLRDQLWRHYKMLLSVMWKFEIATKKRRAIPEVLTDLILDFCGPPDKYVQDFQTKWYRLLCTIHLLAKIVFELKFALHAIKFFSGRPIVFLVGK